MLGQTAWLLREVNTTQEPAAVGLHRPSRPQSGFASVLWNLDLHVTLGLLRSQMSEDIDALRW